jgi:ribosome biogenesis protein YTM1
MASEQEQVQVRFTTQQKEYTVNDSAILLPSNIKKEGLSEIVNSLLDNGKFCVDLYHFGQIY